MRQVWYNGDSEAGEWGNRRVAQSVWAKFEKAIADGGWLATGCTIVVGVSGGPDSLCLLHLFRRLRDESRRDVTVIAAHLDHGIREESAEDACFVASLAAGWGVAYAGERVDVPALAAQPGLSLEEAARLARYRFLRSVAQSHGARVVAVAHHADDQVETVLMHWLRGAGMAGLRGMRPVTRLSEMRLGQDAPAESDILLARPLLDCTRDEIEAYCREFHLEARLDRSNLDTTLFRNRLRHELIPYLESYNPNIREVVRRSARVLAADYDYLHGQMLDAWDALAGEPERGVFEFARDTWATLHASQQAGLLREAVRRLRWSLRNINLAHIEGALTVARDGEVGQKATLPGGLMLTVGYHSFWIADEAWRPAGDAYPALAGGEIPVSTPGATPLGDGVWTLRTEIVAREELPTDWAENPSPWRAYLDAERIDLDGLHMRPRRPGDRFCPLGMGGKSKDVRELMIGIKLPQAARERYPLVVAGEQIVWAPGGRVDERARVGPTTTRILVLTMVMRGDDECSECEK
jgi:tRNA(Ile)-lysidine synthase